MGDEINYSDFVVIERQKKTTRENQISHTIVEACWANKHKSGKIEKIQRVSIKIRICIFSHWKSWNWKTKPIRSLDNVDCRFNYSNKFFCTMKIDTVNRQTVRVTFFNLKARINFSVSLRLKSVYSEYSIHNKLRHQLLEWVTAQNICNLFYDHRRALSVLRAVLCPLIRENDSK